MRDDRSPLYRHGIVARIVASYIDQLEKSFACWRNRLGFMDSFRISRADSGFPVFQNLLELENDRRGAFNYDPLGVLAKTGTLYYPPDRSCEIAAKLAADSRTMSHVRALVADGRPYHEAGGSEAQELAAILATLVAYLRACETAGLRPRMALDQIEQAKAVCRACEAQPACLEFALSTNQESGVWGATSEEERRKLRKQWVAAQRRTGATLTA